MIKLPSLYTTDIKIAFNQAHRGPFRVFFAGDFVLDELIKHRPAEKLKIRGRTRTVKHYGRWTFVRANFPDRRMIIEIPFVSWLASRKMERQLGLPKSPRPKFLCRDKPRQLEKPASG